MLFCTNLAAIVLAACVVYIIFGARTVILTKGKRRLQFTISLAATVVILAFICVQLATSTYSRYLETRTETELSDIIQEWAGPVSVEVLRVDVNSARKRADVWVIVDLPYDAQHQIGSISDLLPERLKQGGLVDLMKDVLGDDYAVAFRYQTRLAGLVYLRSEIVVDAPNTEETTDQ